MLYYDKFTNISITRYNIIYNKGKKERKEYLTKYFPPSFSYSILSFPPSTQAPANLYIESIYRAFEPPTNPLNGQCVLQS